MQCMQACSQLSRIGHHHGQNGDATRRQSLQGVSPQRDLTGCFCKSHWVLCLVDYKCGCEAGKPETEPKNFPASVVLSRTLVRLGLGLPCLVIRSSDVLRASLGLRPTSEQRMWWRRAGATWRSWSMVRRSRGVSCRVGHVGHVGPADLCWTLLSKISFFEILWDEFYVVLAKVPVRGCCVRKLRAIWTDLGLLIEDGVCLLATQEMSARRRMMKANCSIWSLPFCDMYIHIYAYFTVIHFRANQHITHRQTHTHTHASRHQTCPSICGNFMQDKSAVQIWTCTWTSGISKHCCSIWTCTWTSGISKHCCSWLTSILDTARKKGANSLPPKTSSKAQIW